MRERKKLKIDVRQLVLHEAAYRCGNPRCLWPATLDLHHIFEISRGGPDTPENLIVLCKNCHGQFHDGTITEASVRAWKMILLSLNHAFDRRGIDVLLAMRTIKQLYLQGDGLVHIAGLVAAGMLEVAKQTDSMVTGVPGGYVLVLSEKGKAFVEGWHRGDQEAALGANVGAPAPS